MLLVGVGAILAFWYFASRSDAPIQPTFGGAYIEGVAGEPLRVNPLFASENAADQTLVSLVFAGLTRVDDKGAAFPDLAETWTVSPDGLDYTFRLRSGLVWQDGTPLTSEDVVYTYGLLASPGLHEAPPLAAVLEGAQIGAPDAQTVTIALNKPFSPLPSYLALGILPKHLLGDLDFGQLYDSLFNQQPIGAGPYRLEHLTPSEAVLVANPSYYLEQPFIQRLELRFFPDDGAVLQALDAGQITAALFHQAPGPNDMLALQSHPNLRFTTLDTGEVTSVYFNLNLPLFQDRGVRQALLYAVDRDALVKDVLGGNAIRTDSPLPPASWAYAPTLTRYEPDAHQAGLLLDDAGWKLTDGGVRFKDGKALAFKLSTSTDPVHLAVAQTIAAAWNSIGAQVSVEAVGETDLVRSVLEPRNYEAVLFTQQHGSDPDPYPEWHSSEATGSRGNIGAWRDPRVDTTLEEARAAPQPQRKELYATFQDLFAQEVPAIPLYTSTALYVQDAALQGVRVQLLINPGDRFWQVQEWFLKTR